MNLTENNKQTSHKCIQAVRTAYNVMQINNDS